MDALLWIPYYGIPLVCLVVICASILARGKNKSKVIYPIIIIFKEIQIETFTSFDTDLCVPIIGVYNSPGFFEDQVPASSTDELPRCL